MDVNYDDLFKTSERLKNYQELDKTINHYVQRTDEKVVDNSKIYDEIKRHRDI